MIMTDHVHTAESMPQGSSGAMLYVVTSSMSHTMRIQDRAGIPYVNGFIDNILVHMQVLYVTPYHSNMLCHTSVCVTGCSGNGFCD